LDIHIILFLVFAIILQVWKEISICLLFYLHVPTNNEIDYKLRR